MNTILTTLIINTNERKRLTNKYRLFLPIFESQGIVKKSNNKRLNREILRYRHYDFQQKLINKCKLIKGCSVKIVSEAYTTKTCTRCGELNDPGKSKAYNCSECSLSIDRDINGARNIFLRSIVQNS